MNGPIKYIGGKNRLAKVIIQRIPNHLTYVEPFCGGARVFFQKSRSTVEVLNDLDSELVNFYRVCKSHYEELIRSMQFMPVSRELFDGFKRNAPTNLTDIQRAARFIYLQKLSFGGRIRCKSYGVCVASKQDLSYELLSRTLRDAHTRLAGVQIEHLPYGDVVRRYDRSETFFYLDPPYYKMPLYNHNFEHADFVRLVELLRTIKGKFLLSLNDHPQVRTLFADFVIKSVRTSYAMRSVAGQRSQELLISNFK